MTTEQKIAYFKKLISVYTKFLKLYNQSDVMVGKKYVAVKFYKASQNGWCDFDEREFPVADLGKMITVYKGKLKNEYAKRHEVQRKLLGK